MLFLFCVILDISNSLMPMPKSFQKGDQLVKIQNKCSIKYQANHDQYPDFIIELLQHFHSLMTHNQCNFQQSFEFTNDMDVMKIYMNINSLEQLYGIDDTQQESYRLQIDNQLNVIIQVNNHWGLVRALNTLNQLSEKGEINNLPLTIEDEPTYSYRGILIDSARHFLSVELIERTIDSLVMNSMNTIHWHITDDESFPLLLTEYPQITHSTKYSENSFYTINDTTRIVEYASKRGVQIIPSFDSPMHAMSWGMTKELADIMMMCGNTIKQYGILDPTLEKTYQVLESILKDFYQMFKKVKFVNFAGDEVSKTCWDQRPEIKQFMVENNIKDYYELQSYYRKRQKQLWKEVIKAEQDIIYLYRQEDNLPLDKEDIIHWWGYTDQLPDVADKPNRIILMDYFPLFIDAGFGNAFGNPYSVYHTWKEIYKWTPSLPEGSLNTIIGGEVPLWGETNNQNTHFNKLYMRTSVIAETLWNPKLKETEKFSSFVKRLIEMEDRMTKQGFAVTPVTHGYCRKNTELCFPVLSENQVQVQID
ncbi:unnamed protein product [Paramecium sonneborni]|uniref:Beta-hexosaminidase n=1 Tax=Paramecium sonneborni TaxID=65129 RepID=A0A8S1L345_9CILI|nr:unnamed protein product [Paramecium sonneborni]